MNDLTLYIPRFEDLWFYQKMLSDPATMSYNAPWFPPDGCIAFPEAEQAGWYAKWIGQTPNRFYAYLRRCADGAFVGDVNYHFVPERDWWDIGILIFAPERGKGYGRQGLSLLLDRAFRVDGISRLHNEFETGREAAFHIHRAAGFREIGTENGIRQLELTREEYHRNQTVEADRKRQDKGAKTAAIRKVRQGDENTLAYIQTESWKAAFADILDAETLAGCTNIERATAMYRRLLDENKGNGYLLTADGRPHCIAYWDAARDAQLRGKAELICIHSLPDNWRKGYGGMMMDRVLEDIKTAGYAEVVLWVFRDNLRARAFYEAKGFTRTELSKPAFDTEEILYSKKL